MGIRGWAAALAVLVLVGCAPAIQGTPVAQEPIVDVAAMDTGDYPTRASGPYGTAGPVVGAQLLLEAQRLGGYVNSPWTYDDDLVGLGDFFDVMKNGPVSSASLVQSSRIFGFLSPAAAEVAGRHGFRMGFSVFRANNVKPDNKLRSVHNFVMVFPDPESARAAADELITVVLPARGEPEELLDLPEARAMAVPMGDEHHVYSFYPHGRYVLYQQAVAATPYGKASNAVTGVLRGQITRIDAFEPTPPEKLPDLPKDPSGRLLAATLQVVSDLPAIIGAWPPRVWLNYEANPVTMQRLFEKAGVDWISQGTATVYRAGADSGAAGLAAGLIEQAAATANAEPVADPVPGFPGARCFHNGRGAPSDQAASVRRIEWRYKCIAHVDRYAFSVFADSQKDAQQRISAQYRMLAG